MLISLKEPVALGNASRGLLCIHKESQGGSDGSFQSGPNESDASVSEGLIRRQRSRQDKNKSLFQYLSKPSCLFSLRLASQNPRITQLEGLSSNLLLQARSPTGSWTDQVGLEKSPQHLWSSCCSAWCPHGGKACTHWEQSLFNTPSQSLLLQCEKVMKYPKVLKCLFFLKSP